MPIPQGNRRSAIKVGVVSLNCRDELSLSRLNHWLPGCEAHPEVVQSTAAFHHEITDALLPQTDPVFHKATALHAPVARLDASSAMVQGLVGEFLLQRQLLA